MANFEWFLCGFGFAFLLMLMYVIMFDNYR